MQTELQITDIDDAPAYPHDSHVLVVDDDAAIRLIAAAALEEAGYRVSTAANGKMALEQIPQENPDLILLDVIMPERDGFSTCCELRASEWGARIPVIMITALEDSASIERAYQVGATAFVTKPINWVALCHQIQYVLRANRDHQKLAESEARYSLAARGTNDGLWDWDLKIDKVYYSPRWKEMLGYRATEIGTCVNDWLDRVLPDDAAAVRNEIQAHLQGSVETFEVEYRIRDRSGEYQWMLCRGLATQDKFGHNTRMVGSQTDISKRKAAESKLQHDALHDTLTRLANRTLLLDRIMHCINQAHRRANHLFAVVFIDLDRFKTVNDSLGHLAGDRLLQLVAERLKTDLRDGDTLARIGGDEFTLLFEDIDDLATLTRTIERIQHELAKPFHLEDNPITVTASMGIALSNTGYSRPEDVLRDADIAMYRAKALGKNRYEVFDTAMHTQVMAMMRTETELRTGLANQEFRLYYQPIVALNRDEIVGFEALIRWQHPRRGLLEPREFLDVAEETGLIVPIGRWVIEEATRQLATWRTESLGLENAYVSVNLSNREFAQHDLFDVLDKALTNSKLPARCLKFEITETVLIENMSQALRVLNKLRERGVRLSIDDFGTGYSSFNYLHRFPFDVLKIDRAFVHAIDADSRSFEMLKAMVALAHNLGLEVVAEGGETQQELELLRQIGCEFSQGYVFSEPLTPDRLGEYVQRQFHHSVAAGKRLSPYPAIARKAAGSD